MSELSWSPEPWHVDESSDGVPLLYEDQHTTGFIVACDTRGNLAFFSAPSSDVTINEDAANAQRACVCVNFLTGCTVPGERDRMTTEQMLARAVLRGDSVAALALSDEVQATQRVTTVESIPQAVHLIHETIERLRVLVGTVKATCTHPEDKVHYYPDASGNNDSGYTCDECRGNFRNHPHSVEYKAGVLRQQIRLLPRAERCSHHASGSQGSGCRECELRRQIREIESDRV